MKMTNKYQNQHQIIVYWKVREAANEISKFLARKKDTGHVWEDIQSERIMVDINKNTKWR